MKGYIHKIKSKPFFAFGKWGIIIIYEWYKGYAIREHYVDTELEANSLKIGDCIEL